MKKVLVKSLAGNLLDTFQDEDVMEWITKGIHSNRWGLPERQKKLSECSKYELSNVIKIVPPSEVIVGAEYVFEIIDIQSEALEKQKMRQKRLDLVRDWDALVPQRKERLIKRIMCHVLESNDVEVSDI